MPVEQVIPGQAPVTLVDGVTVGKGAFGTVALAVCASSGSGSFLPGTPMAVKDIPLSSDASFLHAAREAVALSMCQCPGVVHLHGLSKIAPNVNSPLGRARLVMEYIPGGTLAQIAKAWPAGRSGHGGLPPVAVARYTRDLLAAVAHCHAVGVAHRDIKGSNVLMTAEGAVKLADFGSARLPEAVEERLREEVGVAGGGQDSARSRAASDGLGFGPLAQPEGAERAERGTLQWMAPEVLLGSLHQSQSNASTASRVLTPDSHAWWCAADMWSVGATVLELLTGSPPWARIAEDSAGVQLAMACVDLRDELPPGLPPCARDFLLACLHPDPGSRPTAAALLGTSPFLNDWGKAGAAGSPAFLWSEVEASPQLSPGVSSPGAPGGAGAVTSPGRTGQGGFAPPAHDKAALGRAKDPGQEVSHISWSSLVAASTSLRRLLPLLRLACRQTERWVARSDMAESLREWVQACACRDVDADRASVLSFLGMACEGAGLGDDASEAVAQALPANGQDKGTAAISCGAHAAIEPWVVMGQDCDTAMANVPLLVQGGQGGLASGVHDGVACAAVGPYGRLVLAAVTAALQRLVASRMVSAGGASKPGSTPSRGGKDPNGGQEVLQSLALLLLALLRSRVACWTVVRAGMEDIPPMPVEGKAGAAAAVPAVRGVPTVAVAAGWLAVARARHMAAAAQGAPATLQTAKTGDQSHAQAHAFGSLSSPPTGTSHVHGEDEEGWDDVVDDDEEAGTGAAALVEEQVIDTTAPAGPESAVFQYSRVHVWVAEVAVCLEALGVLALARRAGAGVDREAARHAAAVEKRVYARFLALRPATATLLQAAGLKESGASDLPGNAVGRASGPGRPAPRALMPPGRKQVSWAGAGGGKEDEDGEYDGDEDDRESLSSMEGE